MTAMSEVTNLLLAFSILEPEDVRIAAVNDWLVRNDQLPLKNVWKNSECVGGSKHMEAPLYAGAFNYLPLGELMAFLRTVPWSQPDEVQLIVNEQDDTRWRVIAA
jgi:hypothetical protein